VMPNLRLPSRPQNVITHWLVPNWVSLVTEAWGWNNLPGVTTQPYPNMESNLRPL